MCPISHRWQSEDLSCKAHLLIPSTTLLFASVGVLCQELPATSFTSANSGHRNTASHSENRASIFYFPFYKAILQAKLVILPNFPHCDIHHIDLQKIYLLQAFLYANPLSWMSYFRLFTHSSNPTYICCASTICQALCHMLGISKWTNKRNLYPQPN